MTKEGDFFFIVNTTDYICMKIDSIADLQIATEILSTYSLTNR